MIVPALASRNGKPGLAPGKNAFQRQRQMARDRLAAVAAQSAEYLDLRAGLRQRIAFRMVN